MPRTRLIRCRCRMVDGLRCEICLLAESTCGAIVQLLEGPEGAAIKSVSASVMEGC